MNQTKFLYLFFSFSLVWLIQKQINLLSFLFDNCAIIHSDTVDFWFFPVALTTRWSVLPLPLSELFINWMCHLYQSTYFNQVYEDNRWWISQYQYLIERRTLWFASALILPYLITLQQPYLLMAKCYWSLLNLRMTMMLLSTGFQTQFFWEGPAHHWSWIYSSLWQQPFDVPSTKRL